MPDYRMMREIAALARDHGPVEIDQRALWKMFEQPERRNPVVDAGFTFCGIPNEKESMESWLRANELEAMPDVRCWGTTWLYRRSEEKSI